jgi:hypothetical protein
LSPLAWATFSAYAAIYSLPLLVFVSWRSGVSLGDSLKKDQYSKIISLIVPKAVDDVREKGALEILNYIDVVEELLLVELKNSIAGKESSAEANDRARAIVEAVEAAQASRTQLPHD